MKKKQIKLRADTAKWVNDVTPVTIDDEHTAHVYWDKTRGYYAEVIHKSGIFVINENIPRGSCDRMTDKCAFCNRESQFLCDGGVIRFGEGVKPIPCNRELCQSHTTQTNIHINQLFRSNKWITHDLCPDCSNSQGIRYQFTQIKR